MSAAQADKLLAALVDAGVEASLIGEVTDGPAGRIVVEV